MKPIKTAIAEPTRPMFRKRPAQDMKLDFAEFPVCCMAARSPAALSNVKRDNASLYLAAQTSWRQRSTFPAFEPIKCRRVSQSVFKQTNGGGFSTVMSSSVLTKYGPVVPIAGQANNLAQIWCAHYLAPVITVISPWPWQSSRLRTQRFSHRNELAQSAFIAA
jgi:hypothetical protein